MIRYSIVQNEISKWFRFGQYSSSLLLKDTFMYRFTSELGSATHERTFTAVLF